MKKSICLEMVLFQEVEINTKFKNRERFLIVLHRFFNSFYAAQYIVFYIKFNLILVALQYYCNQKVCANYILFCN